jgi:ABC-type transport system involved in multi-copper enzyme maturation permease subunit
MTFDRDPFVFLAGLREWLLVFGGFAGVIFVTTILVALGIYGASGPVAVMERIRQCLHDFANLSPKRIWAIALLTILEAWRRKALWVFALFGFLMMFAGWFLDSELRADMQLKNAVSFSLTTVLWLTIPVLLLLSCWGIPEDIRVRSLHTVVTKPVRRNEIVIGRVVGFSSVSAIIVAIMGVVGYVWVCRQVPEDEHPELSLGKRVSLAVGILPELPQEVAVNKFCRMPVYGLLEFIDREGNVSKAGINTGDIWEFRSYIEGGTKAAAIYKFPVGQPVDEIKLESRFEAFRTHKGRIGQSLLVRYVLVNPNKQLRVPLPSFEIKEFGLNEQSVKREVSFYDDEIKDTRSVDLFQDLVHLDEKQNQNVLQVEVQCLDSGQYLGMARPDFFIRLPDRSFLTGYFKAIVGIWLLTVFVVSIGVTASTFVKGPVATLLTFSVLIVGQGFRDFMIKLITGEQKGGGPLESWYRLVTHMNDTLELPETAGVQIMQGIDKVLLSVLWLMQHLIPDLSSFVMSPYVANGFDVPLGVAMARSLAMTIGYLIPCVLVGYYSLTLRELEAK